MYVYIPIVDRRGFDNFENDTRRLQHIVTEDDIAAQRKTWK